MNAKVGQVAQTAFLTLQCHALDATADHPLLKDIDSLSISKTIKRKSRVSSYSFKPNK